MSINKGSSAPRIRLEVRGILGSYGPTGPTGATGPTGPDGLCLPGATGREISGGTVALYHPWIMG